MQEDSLSINMLPTDVLAEQNAPNAGSRPAALGPSPVGSTVAAARVLQPPMWAGGGENPAVQNRPVVSGSEIVFVPAHGHAAVPYSNAPYGPCRRSRTTTVD